MKFEWDPEKSRENQEKHGVSFEEALSLWDGNYLEVSHIAYALDGESREATMGLINQKVYVAIWTRQKKKIRIVSVRRARTYEEKIYWQGIQNGL